MNSHPLFFKILSENKIPLFKEIAKKKTQEEAERKQLEEKAQEKAQKSKKEDRKKSKSPTFRLRLSTGVKNASVEQQDNRKGGKNMLDSRQILTGYYGGDKSRTKIRQSVYDGFLVVPNNASASVHTSIEYITTAALGESIAMSTYELPQVGSVKRPSEDIQMLSLKGERMQEGGGFLITELSRCTSGTTVITNRRCVAKETVEVISIPRIRGGGEGDADDTKPSLYDSKSLEAKTAKSSTPTKDQISNSNKIETVASILSSSISQHIKTENQGGGASNTDVGTSKLLVDSKGKESITTEAGQESIVKDSGKTEEISNKFEVNQAIKPKDTTKEVAKESRTTIESNKEDHTGDETNNAPERHQLDTTIKIAEGRQKDLTTTNDKVPSVQVGQIESGKVSMKQANPDSVSSKSELNSVTNIIPETKIVGLKDKTISDEQRTNPLKGDQERTSTLPQWYDPKCISSFEKMILPEWFDQSAAHRTSKSYLSTRERILTVASKSTTKYVTGTAMRRTVPGDAGSILRLHDFLVSWGFINGSAMGDSAPTQVDRELSKKSKPMSEAKDELKTEIKWSGDMINILGSSVASFAAKKRKRDYENEQDISIDWDRVSQKVGRGVTPIACYNRFLMTNFDAMKSPSLELMDVDDVTAVRIETDVKDEKDALLSQIVEGVRPSVAKVAIDSALQASVGNISEAQKASVLSSVASKAAERAREEENATSHILQEILDQRMAKLENRLSMLDDLECLFDAERMALELERRDLYTLRCRHWFFGNS